MDKLSDLTLLGAPIYWLTFFYFKYPGIQIFLSALFKRSEASQLESEPVELY